MIRIDHRFDEEQERLGKDWIKNHADEDLDTFVRANASKELLEYYEAQCKVIDEAKGTGVLVG